jgi:hypothetical protein
MQKSHQTKNSQQFQHDDYLYDLVTFTTANKPDTHQSVELTG